jgi:hypothetical protein
MPNPVTLTCTAAKLIISGDDPAAVARRLNELLNEGAALIAEPAQVGNAWMAACMNPGLEACATTSAALGGMLIVIRGRTQDIVLEQVHAFQLAGAALETQPRQDKDEWMAVMDTSNTGLMRMCR